MPTPLPTSTLRKPKKPKLLYVADNMGSDAHAKLQAEFDKMEPGYLEGEFMGDLATNAAEAALFPPPARRPIEVPRELFNTQEKAYLFQVAIHEVGHGLGNLIICNSQDALVVQSINGGARGSSFSKSSSPGQDGALVDLAGMVAEQLVAGSGDCIAGATTDRKMARQNLRDAGIPEHQINDELSAIHEELQRVFIRDWLPGIKAAATKLAQIGILSPEAFVDILTNAQQSAHQAGALQKALQNREHHTLMAKAHQFNKAASTPGMTALEVAKLEVLRNHAADSAAQLTGRAK